MLLYAKTNSSIEEKEDLPFETNARNFQMKTYFTSEENHFESKECFQCDSLRLIQTQRCLRKKVDLTPSIKVVYLPLAEVFQPTDEAFQLFLSK